MEPGKAYHAKAKLVGRYTDATFSSTKVCYREGDCIVYYASGNYAVVVDYALIRSKGATGPVLSMPSGAGFDFGGLFVKVAGVASQNWDWTVLIELLELENF